VLSAGLERLARYFPWIVQAWLIAAAPLIDECIAALQKPAVAGETIRSVEEELSAIENEFARPPGARLELDATPLELGGTGSPANFS